MNRTTTIAVCLAMLMIGFVFMAASSNDSSGEGTFSGYELDVSDVENLGKYTFMGTEYTVIHDTDTKEYRDSAGIGKDIIVDSAGIKEGCFQNSTVHSILLTGKVGSIGTDAFKDSISLESVTRYGTAQISIGSGAFKGCSSLGMIDLRGTTTVDSDAFDKDCSAIVAVDSDAKDRPATSCNMLKIDALDGNLNAIAYKDGKIQISYIGNGMLQIADTDGNRGVSSNIIGSDCDLYSFEPIDGKDMSIGYRTIRLDYIPDDLADEDVEIKTDSIEFIDLSNGDPKCKAWHGWRETQTDKLLGKSIDRTKIAELGLDELKLTQECDNVTMNIVFDYNIPRSELSSTHSAWFMKGSDKFPSLPNTEHYRCIGWIKGGDETKTVHPIGSEVRIYRNSVIKAVWEPLEIYNYTVQYTNIDGTDLGEPAKYGHGMTVTVGNLVPSDKPTYQIFNGWRIEGSDVLYSEGSTFVIEKPVKLIPVLEESRKIPLMIDGQKVGEMDSRMGSETEITVDDPVDRDRFFAGWIGNGVGPLFKGDSAILDDVESLSASWKDKKTFTITYLDDDLKTVISTSSVKEKDEVVIHADVTRKDSTLLGWNDGSRTIADGERIVVTRSYTLTAVWESTSSPQHKLVYSGYESETSTFEHGSEATVSFTPDHREGFIFKGWSRSQDKTDIIEVGSKITMDSDITLYPCWEEEPNLKLTYVYGSKTHEESHRRNSDVRIGFSPDPIEGQSFEGWSRSEDGTDPIKVGSSIKMTEDTVLYAVWKEIPTFTITYRTDSEWKESYLSGKTATVADMPDERKGFVFKGWSETANGTVAYKAGDSILISGNKVLYPVWEELPRFKLTYHLEDGTDVKTFYKGERTTLIEVPYDRPNFEFLGWSETVNGTAMPAGTEIIMDSDIDLYAIWKADDSFMVTYHVSGGDRIIPVSSGEEYTIQFTPEKRRGFSFDGWSLESNGERIYSNGEKVVVTGSMDLYPVWTKLKLCSITFMTDPKNHGEAYEGEEYEIDIEPERFGYELIGWSLKENGSTDYDAKDVMTIAGDVTLYPVWKEKASFTVEFRLTSKTVPVKVYEGQSIELTCSAAERPGYDLIGWSKTEGGEKVYDVGERITPRASMSLYPVWKAIPVYTVTYHGISAAPVSVLKGEIITLLDGPVKEGSEFQGWSTNENGSVEYKAGGKMSVYSDTDLYPVWGDGPVFVITYHCEDGIFTSTYRNGDFATLAGTQTKDGFVFAGWSLASNGPVAYLAGSSVRIVSDMDLYPVWTSNTPAEPSGPTDDRDDPPSSDGNDGGSGSDSFNLVSISAIVGVIVAVAAMMVVLLRRS